MSAAENLRNQARPFTSHRTQFCQKADHTPGIDSDILTISLQMESRAIDRESHCMQGINVATTHGLDLSELRSFAFDTEAELNAGVTNVFSNATPTKATSCSAIGSVSLRRNDLSRSLPTFAASNSEYNGFPSEVDPYEQSTFSDLGDPARQTFNRSISNCPSRGSSSEFSDLEVDKDFKSPTLTFEKERASLLAEFAFSEQVQSGGCSDEKKVFKTKEKSRLAARLCRRKKKEYIKCLEERVRSLEEQNNTLMANLKSLTQKYGNSLYFP
eukprot:gene16469-7885_t